MRRAGRVVLAVLALAVASALLVTAGWAVDGRSHQGRVLRNLTLAGQGVGGLTPDALGRVVHAVAERLAAAPVRVLAPGGGLTTDTRALGVAVDEPATVAAVMDTGRRGPAPERLRSWAVGLVRPRRAPLRVRVDLASVYQVVSAEDRSRTPPTEPGIRLVRGELRPVPGRPGRGIDPAAVGAALPAAVGWRLPITVWVGRGPVPPRFTPAHAARVAQEGQALTARPLQVVAGPQSAAVGTARLRSWLRATPSDAGLRLTVDPAQAAADLGRQLPEAGTPARETRFEVVDGAVRMVPGAPGTACCSEEAGAVVEQALRARSPGPVTLPLRAVQPKLTAEHAAALGIKEPVGSFPTRHKPNEPRVVNIHRIADLVRGHVIEPGTTFSINGFVGPRTLEKGFVVDHVIEDGKYAEAVGGGISQFATTTFNAAFFAGLEFVEYQSHSLYISRYPYGREATLSYPHPDLKIRNVTPYGVLIWPTYTPNTITVTLYSTKHLQVTQSAQTSEPMGQCTKVRTERTRRYPDGSVKVDAVRAVYRPAEGVNCSDPPPPPPPPPTTAPGASTPPRPPSTPAPAPSSTTSSSAPPRSGAARR